MADLNIVNLPTADDLEGLTRIKKAEYCHRYGLRELRKTICACVLIGSKKCMGYNADCKPPHWDNPSVFKTYATREVVLVYQPYLPPNPSDDYLDRFTKRIEAFARDWRLTVRVSVEESWHNPGKTVLVELRKAVRP